MGGGRRHPLRVPCGEEDFVAQYEAAQQAAEAGETAADGADSGSEDEV